MQQILGYRHPQPCSFNVAIAFFLNALKFRKEFCHILFFDANARILNRYTQIYAIRVITCRLTTHKERHRSLFRIFHCIGQDIGNNLLDADFITIKLAGHFFIKAQFKRQPFVLRPRLEHIHQII